MRATLRLLVWVLLLGVGTRLGAQLPITRELQDAGNPNAKRLIMRFPAGYLEYRGELSAQDAPLKDKLFGLSFQRPPNTNGGWDLWNFLNVTLHANNLAIPIIQNHLLDSAEILENESRMLIRFLWKIPESESSLRVYLAWYPEQPDWVFLKIQADGERSFIDQVRLSAFPGNSAGPPERERWFATESLVRSLSTRMQPIPPETQGITFFNKYAQKNAGCLLVIGNACPTALNVEGVYATVAKVDFASGTREATFALGGFVNADAESIIRVFNMEGARNTRQFLEKINWTPKIPWERHEILMSDIEKLLADTSNSKAHSQFQKFKDTYCELKSQSDPTSLLEIVGQMDDLKRRLIKIELEKLK